MYFGNSLFRISGKQANALACDRNLQLTLTREIVVAVLVSGLGLFVVLGRHPTPGVMRGIKVIKSLWMIRQFR